ncbi:hypothetical protein AVEN_188030-1 [Araneus ventricosus]|uniref:Uncharacterized protein n=1 Tax=Araneus ventricosus TaxID=182803 RepID=A0A4Y2QA40_ARAVE|nr:hypothetical protein AVEN_188030-1 [Araneus ventricosus]
MDFRLQPSLQHMAAFRTALHLYFDSEIQNMLDDIEIHGTVGTFDRVRNEHWKMTENLAMEKLHSLPKLLRTRVAKLIQPIQIEIRLWERDHRFIDDQDEEIPLKSLFCWKPDGTIDHEQTAKTFVQNEKMDLKIRFIMACTYFMEKEIFYLWHRIKETGKICKSRLAINSAVRFWLYYIQDEVKEPWSEMIGDYYKTPDIRRKDLPIRMSSIFRFLSEEKKQFYLTTFGYKMYNDDFLGCLRQMDRKAQVKLFESQSGGVLLRLLKWPYQTLFIEIAKTLWCHMSISSFEAVLSRIIFHCILKGFRYFDYVQLFREFWQLSPASFQEEMRKDKKFFDVIEATLNCSSESCSEEVEQCLEEAIKKFIAL